MTGRLSTSTRLLTMPPRAIARLDRWCRDDDAASVLAREVGSGGAPPLVDRGAADAGVRRVGWRRPLERRQPPRGDGPLEVERERKQGRLGQEAAGQPDPAGAAILGDARRHRDTRVARDG